MDDPRQNPRFKEKYKTQHSESSGAALARAHHGLTVVGTTTRGSCHGQPTVATFLPGCFSFLCGLLFSHAIFRFCATILPLKRMYLATFKSGFHSLATLKLTQTPLERWEEGERRSSGSNRVVATFKKATT